MSDTNKQGLHDHFIYYEGDCGMKPHPIHGEVQYMCFRNWCDCSIGEDHITKHPKSDKKCGLCGSTAIDHTEMQCQINRLSRRPSNPTKEKI